MNLKRILKFIFLICGLLSITLCIATAVKMPEVFPKLIGITEIVSEIQSVPYSVDFGDLGSSDISYKTQYFKSNKKSWYLSWGSYGSTNHSDENYNFNMILGWNSTKKPVYGGYSYTKEVMKEIELKDEFNYSYLIMDFDFNEKHYLEFSFSAFEDLSSSGNTFVYLIVSYDKGESWSVLNKKNSTELIKDNLVTFTNNEKTDKNETIRYGLVLVSDRNSARLELNKFEVS